MLNEFFQTLQANPPEENKVKKNWFKERRIKLL
jgi:hypothetical protein